MTRFLEDTSMTHNAFRLFSSNCTAPISSDQLDYFSFWTWGTDLAIATMCFAAFIILFFSPRRTSQTAEYLMPFYFCLTGDAYCILGIRNMPTIIDPNNYQLISLLETAAYTVGGVGSLLLLALALALMGVTPRSQRLLKKAFWYAVVCGAFCLLVAEKVIRVEVMFGLTFYPLMYFAILIFLIVAYLLQICKDEKKKKWHYLVKAMAAMIVLFALIYTSVFFPKCGSIEAYKNCYEECPLSRGLSRNAYFHDVILMLGYMLWGWSEDNTGSIETPESAYNRDGVVEDDPTVISDCSFTFSERLDVEAGEDECLDLEVGGTAGTSRTTTP